MSPEMIRNEVLSALKGIAPEVDIEQLRNDRPLREEVDLDSMDWLRFIDALNKRVGIAIPEADYLQVDTLDRLINYLVQKG
ncbi:acyl carrier protein [Pseudomonas sp. FW306-02-F02-AA]|uniref:Phosphopantetheine-binding protein n=1 Tax=Pseudomonas fluorescens TaxID=294 RepID=A0A0N9WIZ6_PSEFL|nr:MULTISPECIES: acyl carrier protein [Pseudomonas]ALI03245.1 phosphopantetheine-binding protein [Pseudomonas fluorescens]PMZ01534.1 acyl carrier protein [Pseudomonas sp. FW306-02-F02-AB]PMZ07349.1 acyl carrier protein [Pseudomonas sp. FW306-02-H06C]PMZ13423.1 acyl carrier protein [Pseudomonas sp. FW306-02-F02-AA]PMZ19007.1 acyl carrier protein [Pseudomonas sp. FW306-02-F08-AA]